MASKYLSDKQEVESCVKNSPHIPERDESALQEQTDSLALKSQALACSLKIPSYAEFVINRPPQSVTQRYFTQHYFVEKFMVHTSWAESNQIREELDSAQIVGKSPNEDQCVLLHSNGVCAICLSPKHQLITKYAQNIESVDFHSGSTDRAANRVSGKRKNKFNYGGQQLQQQSILCAITCSDGERFSIRSCVQGTLLEVNEQLVSNTSLMVSKTVSDGYIALVLPRLQAADKIVAGLLSEDEYMNRLEIQ